MTYANDPHHFPKSLFFGQFFHFFNDDFLQKMVKNKMLKV